MREPLGTDSRASKRVPAGNILAGMEEATSGRVAIDTSRVAKSFSMQRTFQELCSTASLHRTLDELQCFLLPKKSKVLSLRDSELVQAYQRSIQFDTTPSFPES